MITPGTTCPNKVTPQEIAERTIITLARTLPSAVPGVMFLSGGQSEEEASVNLNALNQSKLKRPWALSFSYGRALQHSVIKTWNGKEENVQKAQEALIVRCKANSDAQLGKYQGSSDKNANESLFVSNYVY